MAEGETAPNQAVDDAFHAALQLLTSEDRNAFLSSLPHGMRIEVAALLVAHDAAGEQFLAPTQVVPPTAGVDADPDRIGPFRIRRRLGEGGMGVVYLADQRAPVRRTVALKLVRPEFRRHHMLARFQAERQALAMMDHPGIARVLDAGVTEEGIPYFAMEYVEGQSITRYCNANRLSVKQRVAIFVQACRAIQHAHQKGILHRDIKPSNVMVGDAPGQDPTVKVIDFGLAKALEPETRLTDKTLHTEHGQVMGTVKYMSPEQASLSADLDTRTDVYSLGIVLYELLTGDTPIPQREIETRVLPDLLRAICEASPRKPSTVVGTDAEATVQVAQSQDATSPELVRSLRGDLDWIVMKALEKPRARRYHSAAALADDCERFLRAEPVEARPPTMAYQLSRFCRRHRGAVTVGSIAMMLLFVALGVSSWLAWTNLSLRQEAEQNTAAAARSSQRTGNTLSKMLAVIGRPEFAEKPELLSLKRQLREAVGRDIRNWVAEGVSADERKVVAGLLIEVVAVEVIDPSSGQGDPWRDTVAALQLARNALQPLLKHDPEAAYVAARADAALAMTYRDMGDLSRALELADEAGSLLDGVPQDVRDEAPDVELECRYAQAVVDYGARGVPAAYERSVEMLKLCETDLARWPQDKSLWVFQARVQTLFALTLHKHSDEPPPSVRGFPKRPFPNMSLPDSDVVYAACVALLAYDQAEERLAKLRVDPEYQALADKLLVSVCSNRLMTERRLCQQVSPAFEGLIDRTIRTGLAASQRLLDGSPNSLSRQRSHATLLMNAADALDLGTQTQAALDRRLELRSEAYSTLSGVYRDLPDDSPYGGTFCWVAVRLLREACLAGDKPRAAGLMHEVWDYHGTLAVEAWESELFAWALLREYSIERGDMDQVAACEAELLEVLGRPNIAPVWRLQLFTDSDEGAFVWQDARFRPLLLEAGISPPESEPEKAAG